MRKRTLFICHPFYKMSRRVGSDLDTGESHEKCLEYQANGNRSNDIQLLRKERIGVIEILFKVRVSIAIGILRTIGGITRVQAI